MFGRQSTNRRSRQLYHLELKGGHCELSSPDTTLANLIDYYWFLRIEESSLDLEVIPDAAVDLVLSPDIDHFAALYIPAEEKFTIPLHGPITYTGICFRSDTVWDILGYDVKALSRFTMGSEVVDALCIKPLLGLIRDCRSLEQLTNVFDKFWLSYRANFDASQLAETRISHQALITVLEQSLGTDNIACVCAALDVSERQLRRLSGELFGISPKKLQKILRLQAALEELFACEKSQIRDLYYDDSHRIRELKRLTGCTPNEIRRMAEKYNSP